jgi:hypothetical protein
MMTKPELGNRVEPESLQRMRESLRVEQKMVQKTIAMLQDGILRWEARNNEIYAEIDAIDAMKDREWDALLAGEVVAQ